MKIGDILKNAPNALIVAATIGFVTVIAAFTILSAIGANTDDLRAFVVPIVSALGALFSAGSLIVSGSAAKSSANAEKATNGDFDEKVRAAVSKALTEHGLGDRVE